MKEMTLSCVILPECKVMRKFVIFLLVAVALCPSHARPGRGRRLPIRSFMTDWRHMETGSTWDGCGYCWQPRVDEVGDLIPMEAGLHGCGLDPVFG